MNTLFIYSEINGPRIQYTFREIIRYTPFHDFQILHPTELLHSSNDKKHMLWYAEKEPPEGILAMKPIGFLKEGICINAPKEVYWIEELPLFFNTGRDNKKLSDFDVPAMIFFMLSRAEEYGATTDHLGRFMAKSSMASIHGFLHLPVVDVWKEKLINLIFSYSESRPQKVHLTHGVRDALTVDIDMAFAWRYKSIALHLWALLKYTFQLQTNLIKRMVSVWMKRANDPYDTSQYLCDLAQKTGVELVFFILSGKKSSLDRNLPLAHPAMKALLKKLKQKANIGLHPSYRASTAKEAIVEEKKALEGAMDIPVSISRQHYLLINLPDTYIRLIEAGIKEDHSMLFHDMPGYRAGTALPFYWYDLTHERATPLKIVTYVTMDVSLKNYLCLNPYQATAVLEKARETANRFKLPVRIIWHNSSLDASPGWEGWNSVLESLLAKINQNKQKEDV